MVPDCLLPLPPVQQQMSHPSSLSSKVRQLLLLLLHGVREVPPAFQLPALGQRVLSPAVPVVLLQAQASEAAEVQLAPALEPELVLVLAAVLPEPVSAGSELQAVPELQQQESQQAC